MELGKRLRELRIKNGYKQDDILKKFNISSGRYSQYESGRRKPDYELLAEFADFYNVSIDYLLGRQIISMSEEKDLPIEVFELINKLSGANHEDLKNIAMYTDYVLEQRAKKSGDAGGAAEAASK